jgi:hypothetical protein
MNAMSSGSSGTVTFSTVSFGQAVHPRDPCVGGSVRTVWVIGSNPGEIGPHGFVCVLLELASHLRIEEPELEAGGLN